MSSTGRRCASFSRTSRGRARSRASRHRDRDVRLLAEEAAVRRIRRATEKDAAALADETWAATELIDALGLHTVKAFQKSREEVIIRQQEEMLELSTPVVKLWDGILALPMIGTLDSAAHPGRHGVAAAADRRDRRRDRHHRHHRRADGRHACRPAPAQDGHGDPADGRRLHHQRHPAADRPDHRPPRRRPAGRHDQGHARRRAGARAASALA